MRGSAVGFLPLLEERRDHFDLFPTHICRPIREPRRTYYLTSSLKGLGPFPEDSGTFFLFLIVEGSGKDAAPWHFHL
ncbi:MAG: hypothetical protein ACK559_39020 [bacterium]